MLTVTDQPSIGTPFISVNPRQEEMKALIDIYREVMRTQDLLHQVLARINTPWYIRLWNWLRQFAY